VRGDDPLPLVLRRLHAEADAVAAEIGGRYAGSITRISDRAVINVSAGGGLLPSVIGRHKRRLLAEDEDESEVLDGQKP
jgi:hypothetical protein